MDLIYLAHSEAFEAHPHTVTRPLSLVKLLGGTAIEHNLFAAAAFCERIIIVAGFKSVMIRDLIGGEFAGREVVYVEVKPGAEFSDVITACRPHIRGGLVVLNHNNIYSEIDVQNLAENPGSRLSCPSCGTAGFSFDRGGEDVIVSGGFDTAVAALRDTDVKDYCLPLVYPWHILEANVELLRRFDKFGIHGTVEPGATIKGDVYIGKDTVIKDFCYIEGPVFIDEGCTIGPFAYIRKDTIIGKGVQVGRMEIYDSVIMDGFTSKHNSYAGHSVIGEGGNFGAGTITSDYRHDGGNHNTLINGEKVDTSRRKLGAFLGDNVNTGIGTLIYPGRKIYPGGSTLPGEIVKADKK
jgi:UDP-N-acetylglucosamine diphosphorylase / glucose-1-phosphate thymidylyltransferase / UDP-N-acetylgalactosamine diphosphorylase / glucosamine-1-phosphate N-acetyltransferase / galactosamine-1-phosphate N-acetyltransferase